MGADKASRVYCGRDCIYHRANARVMYLAIQLSKTDTLIRLSSERKMRILPFPPLVRKGKGMQYCDDREIKTFRFTSRILIYTLSSISFQERYFSLLQVEGKIMCGEFNLSRGWRSVLKRNKWTLRGRLGREYVGV